MLLLSKKMQTDRMNTSCRINTSSKMDTGHGKAENPNLVKALAGNAGRKASLFLFILSFSFLPFFASCSSLEKRTLTIKKADSQEVYVKAEIARTPEELQKGYMFRKHIPEGTGMLFIFENDQILNFWMKNTPTPLSIAYITKEGRIKDIFDMTPYSLANITSTGYVRYALEVPQGWFSKQGIKKGDSLVVDF